MTAGSGTARHLGELLLSALATVSWAFLGMVGVAALSLHLMGADEVGALGPMTAAAVAMAVGGTVEPSGDLHVFGLRGAQASSAVDIAPLGVSLVGALLLSWFFLRSLRGAGAVIGGGELAARAGAVVLLFLLILGGLCWVGNDTVTIDSSTLGLGGTGRTGHGSLLDRLAGALGDLGDLGAGQLPDALADLVRAKARVGYTVRTGRSLLGGVVWVLAVLLIALLASRRTPLPRGWEAVHRVVRPAVSALCAVLVLAVVAGIAAGLYAAIRDDRPGLVIGTALLGAPNGVWLGVSLGLFVPWHGQATGALRQVLPDPLDQLLGAQEKERITIGRLAELDSRVWLLVVASVLMVLAAGVLLAVRTPVPSRAGGGRAWGPYGFAGRCALRLGVATALALPLVVWLTGLSAGAGLSVLGFDGFGSTLDLQGSVPLAVLLGAGWGALGGALGALLAWTTGVAGGQVSPFARGEPVRQVRVTRR
ncbi:streptophobe family protein [Streptomyces palmae]|uniref:Integral membrane protein n=1 Tax=Streptomyces palmae TaxID=1701085 RepID=A0A4Z0H9T3_9ACTN|nr:streptophobe family protein [Streptomyces palmae]TGB14520.1 hypothetical protein E4099_08330 [Streptomyces palmae]